MSRLSELRNRFEAAQISDSKPVSDTKRSHTLAIASSIFDNGEHFYQILLQEYKSSSLRQVAEVGLNHDLGANGTTFRPLMVAT